MLRGGRFRFVVGGLLAGVTLMLAGCGSGTVVSPLPQTVIGPVPKAAPTLVGNPAGGKAVFASSGCGACHTLAAAGATGTIGPNLDNLTTYAQKANQALAAFTRAAIVTPPAAYVPPPFPTNVMPATFGQSLKPQQLADLVAFLDQAKK
jgi:cytochrome c2